MKALILEQPFHLTLHDVPTPEIPPGWVLVKPIAVSICGSDYHSYRGENALLTYPRILGHEVCGRVVSTRRGSGFSEGDKVVLMPYLSCGSCRPCRKGKTNCCDHLSVYGVHRDGALADYFAAPADHLVKIEEKVDASLAALVEPLSISTHAVERSSARKGDDVLVLGAGPIGTGAALMARHIKKAHVALADPDPSRRAFVAKEFGFADVFDPNSSDYETEIHEWSHGQLADIVIDSTGNNLSMAQGLNMLCHGGRMVWVGISSKAIALDGTAFHVRETELFDSRAAFPSDFDEVIFAIESGLVNPRGMITHQATFVESEEAFRKWEQLRGKVFKAIVKME